MGLERHPKYQNIDEEVVRTKEVDGHVIAFIPNPNRESIEEISKKIVMITFQSYLKSKTKLNENT